MRKLTNEDITKIKGTMLNGYRIEDARIKRGPFTDSDHYGIVLCKDSENRYVTWQFHLDENDKPNVYWGHYFMEDREAAIRDFNNRDIDSNPKEFEVTIIETLLKSVIVKAGNKEEAEEIVSGSWRNGEHILDSGHFLGVDFDVREIE